jgi:toxin ParE1/3/4
MYFFTKRAISDLEEIWEYTTENWSERQAEKYYKLLISSCKELVVHPGLGKDYSLISKGLLGYKTAEHIIFYYIKQKREIEIVRILHVSMDCKSRLES